MDAKEHWHDWYWHVRRPFNGGKSHRKDSSFRSFRHLVTRLPLPSPDTSFIPFLLLSWKSAYSSSVFTFAEPDLIPFPTDEPPSTVSKASVLLDSIKKREQTELDRTLVSLSLKEFTENSIESEVTFLFSSFPLSSSPLLSFFLNA